MNITEGMGRRECKNGTELDHLTKAHHVYIENHGIRGKIKAGRNRRVRRGTREALRSGRFE